MSDEIETKSDLARRFADLTDSELIWALYERSKTVSSDVDSALLYQASLVIGILKARIDSLSGNPDDELHG